MINGMKKSLIVISLSCLVGCLLFTPSLIYAQKKTHIVQKGDTLWDICEEYYGNPDLWPELWQMNPFITNPHLLKPGDEITLFEQAPDKKVKEAEPPSKPPEEPAEPGPRVMGFDLTGRADPNTIGFLSRDKSRSWGTIIASDNDKLILDENDTAYVLFDEDKQILAGDEFSVGKFSPLLEHPVKEDDLGYTFSVRARLVVEKKRGLAIKDNKFYRKENVYQVRITEVYNPIYVGDQVVPPQSVSSCVLPVHYEKDLLGHIVAAKDQQMLLHTDSIVYLDLGFNDGINRGNIFQVVRGHVIDDPKPEKDEWYIKSKIILPDIPMGKILVLESRPDTATAIVLTATEPFSTGVYFKNVPWQDVLELLESNPKCPIE